MGRHVVWLLIDGLRKDKLDDYLVNHIPHKQKSGLKQLSQLGNTIAANQCSTVFPSITFAAHASMFTGRYPSKTGIVGNVYFDTSTTSPGWRLVNWESLDLAPTLYGFYDEFGNPWGPENWAALLNQPQQRKAGAGGLDKELASNGVLTVYDMLREQDYSSHVVFDFYSKGAGIPNFPLEHEDVAFLGDGWDPPGREDLFFGKLFGGNDDESFFNHFDSKAAEAASVYIERLHNNGLAFPDLLTIYFASIDHASHLMGLYGQQDTQLEYLGRIDELLNDIINTLRIYFPNEYNETVFIVLSDHGHQAVDPNKVITPEEILKAIYKGTHISAAPAHFGIALNGTMAMLSLPRVFGVPSGPEPPGAITDPIAIWYEVIKRLKDYFEKRSDKAAVIVRGPRAPWEHTEHNWLHQEVEKMLKNSSRAGDIILLANEQDGWQFAGGKTHAKELVVNVPPNPFISDFHMRIPFSEVYANSSTHGSLGTMEVPLMFFGKPIPKSVSIGGNTNIVDIVPTILSMFGISLPLNVLDGRALLDVNLNPLPLSPRPAGLPWLSLLLEPTS